MSPAKPSQARLKVSFYSMFLTKCVWWCTRSFVPFSHREVCVMGQTCGRAAKLHFRFISDLMDGFTFPLNAPSAILVPLIE